MRRCEIEPRAAWRSRVESQGLIFHSVRDQLYWAEGTYYELAEWEVDAIEAATRELERRCFEAVAHVIERRRYTVLGLDPLAIELVEKSWRRPQPALYGRMDLAVEAGVPKLLEYNADTPTSLLECGVIQWSWLDDCFRGADQANSIHDRLIETWRRLAPEVGNIVHFAYVDAAGREDEMTVGYLRDTAEQAGLRTIGLPLDRVGWDISRGALVDLTGTPIRSLFKLYPWEGLLLDELAPLLPRLELSWLEPAWKMILSNKAILPILWELFPGHPNLLPASREPLAGDWVRKPLFGREGSNVTVRALGVDTTTPGPYDDRGYVYQAYAELGCHDGMRPVVGSWVIGGRPAGIGIRETATFVTDDTARFVPHRIG